MKYLEVAEARDMPGVRLVLTANVPGPWGESAKKIFEYKRIEYAPVAQHGGQENADLVAWTGTRNAPVAVYEDELPRTGWYDILMLGERLAPGRPLLPDAPEDRALVTGLSNEICGEWGFGWTRRLMMMKPPAPDPAVAAKPAKSPFAADAAARMARAYSATLGDVTAAEARCAAIVRALAARLHRQHDAGSRYLVGDRLTACDIHWTVFSSMLEPLPQDVNPMPDWMRRVYEATGEAVAAASDPALIAHRDYVYAEHLSLPLDF